MIRSREAFPMSLRHALLANRVVSALSQAGEEPEPTVRKAALDEAILFLNSIITGRNLTRDLQVSEGASQAALAYGEGIRAVELLSKIENTSPDIDIEQLFTKLMATAVKLKEEEKVREEEVEQLGAFFRCVRDLANSIGAASTERVQYGV